MCVCVGVCVRIYVYMYTIILTDTQVQISLPCRSPYSGISFYFGVENRDRQLKLFLIDNYLANYCYIYKY